MKKTHLPALAFGILFLFFFQMAGTLIESIYILDLLRSGLDEKALGLLFFFVPLLALPLFRKRPRALAWTLFGILLVARGLAPYLDTVGRLFASGTALAAALALLFLLLSAKAEEGGDLGIEASAGIALAVALSALARAVGDGLDYSLGPAGSWSAWPAGLALAWPLFRLTWHSPAEAGSRKGGATAPIVGLYAVATLLMLSLTAPSAIARWTEGEYLLIVLAVSLAALAWVLLSLARPGWIGRVSPPALALWNSAFALSLAAAILAHRVPFPSALGAPAVVAGPPSWIQQLPLALMLLLSPVLYLDLRSFAGRIVSAAAPPMRLVPGILIGSAVLIIVVFMQIFTNVWGYIRPVSPLFRNLYWLPYLALSALVTILALRGGTAAPAAARGPGLHWAWPVALGAVILGSLLGALPAKRVPASGAEQSSFVAMTFNTQQSNDREGEKSYDRQIALIRKVSPDILALQESDSARISLNNNDYVRYFAERLGYYSYYGPTTVTGTYGTAILSKYPLSSTRTAFMYSDKDECGVAEAVVEIGGRRIAIYDVHPDSSDPAMVAFARTLLERSEDEPYAVALGDFNLRDYEEAYKIIDGARTNAWTSLYPNEIGADGLDMSGESRIDHIFVSAALGVRRAGYIPPPASGTDHPVHWAEIFWK